MTWRYISIIPCPLVFLSDFPTTSFDVSHVMATCLFCFLSSGRFCILRWDCCISWWVLLTVSPKDNTLLTSELNKYCILEHTDTHTCSSSSSSSACAVGGGPNVFVGLIPSYIKRYIKKYKENRRPALCIATMKLPPIWESWSVWKLEMLVYEEKNNVSCMHYDYLHNVSINIHTYVSTSVGK